MEILIHALGRLESACHRLGVLDPGARLRNNVSIRDETVAVARFLRGRGLSSGLDPDNNLNVMVYISEIVRFRLDISVPDFNEDGDTSPFAYRVSLELKFLRRNPGRQNDYGDPANLRFARVNERVLRHHEDLASYIVAAINVCHDWQTAGLAGPITNSRKRSRDEGQGGSQQGGPTERRLSEMCAKNSWRMEKSHTEEMGVFKVLIYPLKEPDRSVYAAVTPDWAAYENVHLEIHFRFTRTGYAPIERTKVNKLVEGNIQTEIEEAIITSIGQYKNEPQPIWPRD